MDVTTAILAAGSWTDILVSLLTDWVWPLVAFFLGLGLMVVAHEFGHFIVAKAVGIKVERFAAGFGPRLFGIVRGGTDYCINAIPFGGYVKMLGQEDLRPLEEVGQEERDPRSFRFKSVSARMAVISAGVVMNAILAIILFIVVVMVGIESPAPILGTVQRHYPAAEAKVTWQAGAGNGATTRPVVTTGLRPGDRITRIDGDSLILAILGNEVQRFDPLALLSATANRDQEFSLTVEREVDGNTWVGRADMGLRLAVSGNGGGRLSFGLAPARDVLVRRGEDDFTTSESVDPFQDRDRILTVGGRKVRYAFEIDPIVRGLSGPTVPVTVRRGDQELTLAAPRVLQFKENVLFLSDGTKLDVDDYSARKGKDGEELVFKPLAGGREIACKADEVVWAQSEEILDMLGMIPPLRITAVIEGSPAQAAGLRPGDVIVHYGDTPLPTIRQLHKVSDAVAEKSLSTKIAVDRDGKRMEAVSIRPRWDRKKKAALIGVHRHVDLCRTIVAGVRRDSPAAAAGIQSGFVVDQVNGRPVTTWLEVFEALKSDQGRDVTLTVRPSDRADAQPQTIALGPLTRAMFDPDDYQYTVLPGPEVGFTEPVMVTIRKTGMGDALVWSARETAGFMLGTYASFRALFQGTVSRKDFMGPVGIGAIAVSAARMSFMRLVYVMALMSAILGVMNFLPFPVLDGGHAVLLIVEKVRGKPAPVKLLNALQLAGLAVICLLFLALTWQDISRLLF